MPVYLRPESASAPGWKGAANHGESPGPRNSSETLVFEGRYEIAATRAMGH